MKFIHRLKLIMPIIAVVLAASCVGTTLAAYETPTYAATPQEQKTVSSAQAAKKVAKKMAQKQLPAQKSGLTNSPTTTPIAKVTDPGEYKDGVYTGSAQGFRGLITVQVTIRNAKIAAIKIIKSTDDQAYLRRAQAVINRILKSQNTNVDTVSGATYSSNGIIGAVRNALEKAAVNKSSKNNQTNKSQENKKNNKKQKEQSATDAPKPSTQVTKQGNYYIVTVPCSPDSNKQFSQYNLTVKVQIIDGKIKSVEIISATGTKDDELYWGMARDEINDGLPVTSASGINAVSGATCSSAAIKEACRLALEEAKKYTDSTDSNEGSNNKPEEDGTSGNDQNQNPDPEEPTDQNHEDDNTDQETKQIYQDGSYTASVTCRWQAAYCAYDNWTDYPLSVTVVIANDMIAEISAAAQISGSGAINNKIYINSARKGINGKLPAVSADAIDTVSGATCSSLAIKEACKAALEQAKAAKGE